MSDVIFLNVQDISEAGVFATVKKAMELGRWDEFIKGPKIFLKINGISDQVVPGQCTSPWVLEAVIRIVKEQFPGS